MKKKATKKRNPQDTTLRNINALKKRVAVLELESKNLDELCDALSWYLMKVDALGYKKTKEAAKCSKTKAKTGPRD